MQELRQSHRRGLARRASGRPSFHRAVFFHCVTHSPPRFRYYLTEWNFTGVAPLCPEAGSSFARDRLWSLNQVLNSDKKGWPTTNE